MGLMLGRVCDGEGAAAPGATARDGEGAAAPGAAAVAVPAAAPVVAEE